MVAIEWVRKMVLSSVDVILDPSSGRTDKGMGVDEVGVSEEFGMMKNLCVNLPSHVINMYVPMIEIVRIPYIIINKAKVG